MESQKLPPPDPSPSLAERLGAAMAAPPEPSSADGRRLGWMLALMLPLGPLLTLGAAEWLSVRSRAEGAGANDAATRRAAALAGERRTLARLGEGGIAPTLDRIARALPAEDRLVSAAMADGEDDGPRLSAEIMTADPDRLRAALSRDALLGLRSVGERPGDGVLIVRLEAGR